MTKLDSVSDNPNDKSPEQKAIEKELYLLEKSIAEGKKNNKRAQRAMQKVLGSQQSDANSNVDNTILMPPPRALVPSSRSPLLVEYKMQP
jgi:hypothetical protein